MKQRLSSVVHIRVSDVEHERLAAEAEANGLTLSAYLRARVLGSTSFQKLDPASIAAIRDGIAELRRSGGLLKMLHESGDKSNAFESKAVLIAIGAAIENLASMQQ